ncbi:MAG: hypothetical protein C4345_06395, partial [Chloroflexota bacterium]
MIFPRCPRRQLQRGEEAPVSISIKTCPSCGQANPATNAFCPNCGEVISGVTPVVRPSQAAHGFFAIPAYLRMPPRRRRP